MLSASVTGCPKDARRVVSWSPMSSPNMLSASKPKSVVFMTLGMLALSSASLGVLDEPRLRPKYERGFGVRDGLCVLDSFWWLAESAKESWVVAWETKRGLPVVTECEVEGRESRRPRFGRGGSGGGVPSLDTAEASDSPDAEGLRDRLFIILIVGFAKPCGSSWSFVVGAAEGELAAISLELSGGPSDREGSTEDGSVMIAQSSEIHGSRRGTGRQASWSTVGRCLRHDAIPRCGGIVR